jgi:hypothetical protein
MGGGARPVDEGLFLLKNVGFLFLLLLTGCTVHVHTGSDAAKAIGVGVVAAMIISAENETEHDREPPLDPSRKVSEQDCTKPIDWSAGNLRCK